MKILQGKMIVEKTYTISDLVNGVFNWINRLDTKSFLALSIIFGWIISENSPSGYYKPRPLKRKDFAESVKAEILAKQGHRCNSCNRVLNVVNFDHMDGNRSNNDVSNCQALCPNCHAKKTRRK